MFFTLKKSFTLKTTFFLIFFLFSGSVFAKNCRGSFSDSEQVTNNETVQQIRKAEFSHFHTGTESYEDALGRLARSSLGVDALSPQQMEALENYHSVVRGEKGEDGTFVRAGNYTLGQKKKIIRYLESKGFSSEQVRTLIESGVVEINRLDVSVLGSSRKIWKNVNKGENVFIMKSGGRNAFYRIDKVLEETKNGVLAELETLDNSGQIVRSKVFFPAEKRPEGYGEGIPEEHYPYYMKKVVEKTGHGFIVDIQFIGNAFFSFEKAVENGLLPRNPGAEDYRKLEDLLNHFISSDEIPGGNKAIDELANLFKESLLVNPTSYVVVNSEVKVIFSAAQSTKQKISYNDLNLSPSTSMESDLAKEGFKETSYGSVDKMNEWSEIRKELQELQANPYITHVKLFEKEALDRVGYIREGLLNNKDTELSSVSSFPRISFGKKTEKLPLEELEDLEKEIQEAISNEKMTYKLWVEFHIRLAEIMSGNTANLQGKENEYVRGLVRDTVGRFPLYMIVPTTEKLGLISFRRGSLEGIYPASLSNQKETDADGYSMSAIENIAHDFNHSFRLANHPFIGHSAGHYLFHKRMERNIESLPIKKRKQVEAVYFLMTHEGGPGDQNISYSNLDGIEAVVNQRISADRSGAIRLSSDPSQRAKKVRDLIDAFMEVYNQAQQHL